MLQSGDCVCVEWGLCVLQSGDCMCVEWGLCVLQSMYCGSLSSRSTGGDSAMWFYMRECIVGTVCIEWGLCV